MLEAIEYEWRHFNTESPNIYYGTPNDDLETAWDGSTGIHDEKLHLLNKSLEVSWKHLPDELGGGVQAFFEGFHQIHCLDLVRQFSYRDEYDYSDVPAFLKHADTLYDHVDHCLETLRINVMCNADTTPYLIEVMEGGEKVVRTDALYRCRNFDNMIEWANKNIILPYNTTEERLKTIREEKKKVEYGINGGQAI
ncbi:hypothetical protein N7504_004381 [Penicillium tannophilum]|nr:hypothetical protein N7504_004381 [Penicillium tannophilum]